MFYAATKLFNRTVGSTNEGCFFFPRDPERANC
jgi:hypothetical protein